MIDYKSYNIKYVGLLDQSNEQSVMFINRPYLNPLNYAQNNRDCLIIHNHRDVGNREICSNTFIYDTDPRLRMAEIILDGINRVYGMNYGTRELYESEDELVPTHTNVPIIIGSNFQFGHGVRIGIKDFCTICDANNKLIMMPQIGGVKIGNDVYIGHNSSVARGTFIYTEIGDETKIDSNCYIPHNAIIGKRCVITSGVTLCGSVVIGDETFIGVGAIVNEGVHIGKQCTIGSGSVILENIPDNSVVVGNPGRIIKQNTYFDLNEFRVRQNDK